MYKYKLEGTLKGEHFVWSVRNIYSERRYPFKMEFSSYMQALDTWRWLMNL